MEQGCKEGGHIELCSINSRVNLDDFLPCYVWESSPQDGKRTIAARQKFPNWQIFITKIDFKSAFRQCHLNAKNTLQTCVQFPEDKLAIMSLRLSFRGRPCPQEWSVLAEPIWDLSNTFLKSDEWDPKILFSPYQHLVPPIQMLDDDTPFGKAKELVVEAPSTSEAKPTCTYV